MLLVTRATFKFLSFSNFTNQGFIVLPFRKFSFLYHFYGFKFAILLHNFSTECSSVTRLKLFKFFLVYFYGKNFFCVQFFYIWFRPILQVHIYNLFISFLPQCFIFHKCYSLYSLE